MAIADAEQGTRDPSALPNPLCGTTKWLLSRFGFTLALLLSPPFPPSYCRASQQLY